MWIKQCLALTLVVTLSSAFRLDIPSALPELENGGVHWALIVAGSNTWSNYRHQADICHAYQILHRNGIPDERIVVMMYDDIAQSDMNPHKGVVINHINGTNLYKGVPKDYTGEAVDPKVFIKVLLGEKAGLDSIGSGKVINSGPNDNIFVFFADHGAPGLIAFPEEYLYASQLIKALKKMYKEKKYAKMLIYIEACESGSMFRNLPKDINIFGVTAANGRESSYACYYDEELETYLGDVFSVTWMENSDKVSMNKETVQQQFSIVKKNVTTSHVQEFGDMSIGKLELSAFQGPKANVHQPADNTLNPSVNFDFSNAVHSRQVTLNILKKKLLKAKSQFERKVVEMKLYQLYKERNSLREIFRSIVENLTKDKHLSAKFLGQPEEIINEKCYEEAVEHFRHACAPFRTSEHVFEHYKSFVSLCNANFFIGHITNVIDRVCSLMA